MNKLHINHREVRELTLEIIRQLVLNNFIPDLVIGLTRGGLVPANDISQFFNVPMYALNKESELPDFLDRYPNILVVDDINDTGRTFTDVNNMFSVEGYEVRYVSLLDNVGSDFTVDYSGRTIDKANNPVWIVFPWESWWCPTLRDYI